MLPIIRFLCAAIESTFIAETKVIGLFYCSIRNEALRCLKRSDLVEALANGLPNESIRFGCQVAAIGTDLLTSFPIVHLNDGTNIKAKVH